ncbi:MAG: hypothetical protein ABR500_10430 [Dermatophilaceae bacterium]|nr:DUF2510 domain-containing protein [Intrasporangiaceae bacterium]
MSTAPPGWHRQPDGRDRFWDGQRWTDEFRDPSEATTQQIPLDETRGMSAAESQGGYASQAPGAGSAGQGGQGPYAPPPAYGGGPDAYGQGGPLSDSGRGGSGWLKGCLIALLVVVILVALLAVGGMWLFRSASDRVSEAIESAQPTAPATDVPSEAPGDVSTEPTAPDVEGPTGLPTGLPSLPGQGAVTQAGLGEEFTLGPAMIQSGWTVEDITLGFATITMSAIPSESSAVPMIFEIVFYEGDADITRTTCTVPLDPVGETVDVACVPVVGFADGVDRIEATALGTG